jgi:hypothetical protein
MENGREKARTSKVTAVMLMWSALLFGITWRFSPSAFAYRETAAIFPIIARSCYFQVTLPSARDAASRGSTRIWDEERRGKIRDEE